MLPSYICMCVVVVVENKEGTIFFFCDASWCGHERDVSSKQKNDEIVDQIITHWIVEGRKEKFARLTLLSSSNPYIACVPGSHVFIDLYLSKSNQ